MINVSPPTCNFDVGTDIPIPTSPVRSMRSLSIAFVYPISVPVLNIIRLLLIAEFDNTSALFSVLLLPSGLIPIAE